MIASMEGVEGGVVGRDAELAAVDSFLTTARSELAVLVLEGEPGIGKTTVWREAVRRAGDGGAWVVLTRPNASEAVLSLAALADVFDAVDDGMLSRLPAPQREAICAALLRAPAPPRGIDERTLCASVLSLLRSMSAEGPLLVAVDDAQWLDTPSARALSFAIRRLDAEPIGVLVTVRTGGVRSPSFDSSAEPRRRRSISLGPLSIAALHALIKQRTARSLTRPTLVQVANACGGNPFYALEIATELGDRPLDDGRLPIPAGVAELVAARLERLPMATRRNLLVASALSQPTIDLVDVAALEPAVRAGIVSIARSRIRFAHPLFASAVYSRADEAKRRLLHRRLAEIVSEPEERARHAALGAAEPDAAIASELEAAAALAGSRGAPGAAAELQGLAVRLTPPSHQGERAARLVTEAAFWFATGDLLGSQARLEQALAEPVGGPPRARALHLLSQLHSRRSSFTEATAAASLALESAADDPELCAELELDLAYFCVSLADLPGAEQHARAAVDAATQAAIPGALADALAVLTMTAFVAGRGLDEDRIARARELEDPGRGTVWQMSPAFIHGLLMLYSGRLDQSLSILGELHTRTLERGEESPIPFSCLYLTWVQLWRGDLAAAGRFADEARATAALLDDPAARGMALTASALVHAHDGASAEAREEALAAIGCFEGLGWALGSTWPLWALGLAELSIGDAEAVDAALWPMAAMLLAMGGGDPLLGVFLPDEIEALVEVGQLDRAESLVEWLERRGTELDRPWARAAAARCRGLLCATRGDRDGALDALDSARGQHDRQGFPFERARTLLTLGRVQRRCGMRRQAATTLHEALGEFEQFGAPIWAGRTRAELDRLGRSGAASDALTPTEARVAELAASGLSNREIAERAFLTTKAVEANLTRVYGKLAIRSRGGLARALATTARETTQT